MKGKWHLALLGVVVVLSLATIQACGPANPYLTGPGGPESGLVNEDLVCQDPGPHYPPVQRGQSVDLMNPCPVRPGAQLMAHGRICT
jgi:hypothetical protein